MVVLSQCGLENTIRMNKRLKLIACSLQSVMLVTIIVNYAINVIMTLTSVDLQDQGQVSLTRCHMYRVITCYSYDYFENMLKICQHSANGGIFEIGLLGLLRVFC